MYMYETLPFQYVPFQSKCKLLNSKVCTHFSRHWKGNIPLLNRGIVKNHCHTIIVDICPTTGACPNKVSILAQETVPGH